jgi:hypothetical protein
MSTVRLVSWKEDLAREHARILKKAGFQVDASPFPTDNLVTRIRKSSPAVILIDLDRLPSHGRVVAVVLRSSKSARHIPIVFSGGPPEKVDRIRRELPDAFFTDWSGVARSLKKALQAPTSIPANAKPYMPQYAGSSLVQKLGFKPNMKAALLGAPDGFEEQLAGLPEGVELQTKMNRQTELAIWFVRSRAELERETDYLGVRLPAGVSLWIVHPKQTSRHKVDFNQHDVRAAGLATGLVDYKVCSIDADWSGLKFARKKA